MDSLLEVRPEHHNLDEDRPGGSRVPHVSQKNSSTGTPRSGLSESRLQQQAPPRKKNENEGREERKKEKKKEGGHCGLFVAQQPPFQLDVASWSGIILSRDPCPHDATAPRHLQDSRGQQAPGPRPQGSFPHVHPAPSLRSPCSAHVQVHYYPLGAYPKVLLSSVYSVQGRNQHVNQPDAEEQFAVGVSIVM